MSITTLYNTEKSLKNFSDALEYTRGLNPLAADIAMHMKAGDDSFGIVEQFANNVSKPIFEVISTQQGLDAAKQKYDDAVESLPDQAQKTIMTVLFSAPEKIRRNAMDMLTHCLEHSDIDTQTDFLISAPFDHSLIENGHVDLDESRKIIAASTPEAQAYILEACTQEATTNLGLYAFNVRAPQSNTTMAMMRDPSDAVIPFDQIENDLVRAYCEDHEKQIRNSVEMLDPDLSKEVLDKLEKVYAEHNLPFDRDAENNKRSQEFRDHIAGMAREDYWEIFKGHAQVIQVILEHQAGLDLNPEAKDTHEHD